MLFGRQADMQAIFDADERFSLVVGDSGIGKSSFMAALNVWPDNALISKPIVLGTIGGALQTALADATSDCLQQFVESAESDPQAALAVLKSVVKRVKTTAGRELAQVVLSGAVGYLESKVGKEAVGAGKRLFGELKESGALGLASKLAALKVPNLLAEISDVAAALSEASNRRVVLRLDNAERLSPVDLGLLVELPAAIRGNVRIVACVSPHTARGDEIIHEVTLRGFAPFELRPLDRAAIEEWLASAAVPRSRWDAIARVTSGYPLFISDAVRLSESGVSFAELATPIGFEALMRASWGGILPALKQTAAQLAPFLEPPDDEFLLEYLSLDPLQWAILTDELVKAGIFIKRSDGRIWFHDRRRAFVWDEALNDAARTSVSSQAYGALSNWVSGKTDIEAWIPAAAALLAKGLSAEATGEKIRALLDLNDDELILLWGLIEVVDPSAIGGPWAEINEVVSHAEERAGRRTDAIASMTSLEAVGLLEVFEERDVRLVRLLIGQNTDFAVLLGEVERRFHVAPWPRFASAVFDAFVRPRLGTFEKAAISVGYADLSQQKRNLKDFATPGTSGVYDHGFAATVAVDDQRVSFTVKFKAPEERERAVSSIELIAQNSSRVELVGLRSWPRSRVRFARFEEAGKAIRRDQVVNGRDRTANTFDRLNLKASYLQAFGSVSTDDEVEALRLGPHRYLVDVRSTPPSCTTFEVRTAHPSPTADVTKFQLDQRDPLLELRLRSVEHLSSSESVVRTTTHFGVESYTEDPLDDVLQRIKKAGEAFNQGLPSVLIPPDQRVIEGAIRAERLRLARVIDATSMIENCPVPVPDATILVAFWEDPQHFMGGDFGHWSASVLKVDDGAGAVVVTRLDAPLGWPRLGSDRTVPGAFPDHVGMTVTSWSSGDATYSLAPLLGYTSADARLMNLDSPLGEIMRKSSNYDVLGETV